MKNYETSRAVQLDFVVSLHILSVTNINSYYYYAKWSHFIDNLENSTQTIFCFLYQNTETNLSFPNTQTKYGNLFN